MIAGRSTVCLGAGVGSVAGMWLIARAALLGVASGGRSLAGPAAVLRPSVPAVRVLVLTGTPPAFCAGADLGAGAATFSAPGPGFSAAGLDVPAWALSKPVIAAINGHALGLGLTLALQCDIRFFAADAKYGVVQVRRGVVDRPGLDARLAGRKGHETLANVDTTTGLAASTCSSSRRSWSAWSAVAWTEP